MSSNVDTEHVLKGEYPNPLIVYATKQRRKERYALAVLLATWLYQAVCRS